MVCDKNERAEFSGGAVWCYLIVLMSCDASKNHLRMLSSSSGELGAICGRLDGCCRERKNSVSWSWSRSWIFVMNLRSGNGFVRSLSYPGVMRTLAILSAPISRPIIVPVSILLFWLVII